MSKYQKVLFAGDFHAPYQDERCLSSFLQFSNWFKPDIIFLIGDVIDFYAISRFNKDPNRSLEIQDEIDCAKNILSQIRRFNPKAGIVFIKGNHEERLKKYLWSVAKELANLKELSIDRLLGLKELNILYEDKGRLEHRGLIIKHGSVVRKYSGYSARAEFEKTGRSGVSGHTHRANVYYQNNDGGEYAWMECGCMCRKDQEYMEGEIPNWQRGWGVGYFKNNANRFSLDFVPFADGKAMYQGKEFI
jgi:predicted phosphodiesterase